jgi:hypothetical protein
LVSKIIEVGDDADQDLLRRVASVLGMPEHTQGQSVNPTLNLFNDTLERGLVSHLRKFNRLFNGQGSHYRAPDDVFRSRISRSLVSSSPKMRDCCSTAPSICSRGSGGGISMKL